MKKIFLLNNKKRKFEDGTTFAEIQKQWRMQQRNGKLAKDKLTANRRTWKEYLAFQIEFANAWGETFGRSKK